MITLSSWNQCKRCLHAPTLKVYMVVEYFIKDKEHQKKIRNYLDFYVEVQDNLERSIKICNLKYNQPENHISVISDFQEGGSLQQILDTCIGLPEGVLKKMSIQVLQSLLEFHQKTGKSFRGLLPNQILFDSKGNQKLGLGIKCKFLNCEWKNQIDKIKSLFSEKQRVKSPQIAKNSFIQQIIKEDNIVSDDIFDAGLIFLYSAVGQVQILVQEIQKCDLREIPQVQKEMKQKQQNNSKIQYRNVKKNCCLLHMIIENAQFKNNPFLDYTECNFVANIISRNFSDSFINFLCKCLRTKEVERNSIKKLLEDEFLITSQNLLNTVDISDLIKISRINQGREELDRITKQLPIIIPFLEKYQNNSIGIRKIKNLANYDKKHPYILSLSHILKINPSEILIEIKQSLINGTNIFQ